MKMNSTTTTTTTMTASKFSLCMLPSNIFVSQELGAIVARIHELLEKTVGVCFEFEDSCAEFTAYYIRAFKHCKFQITVFYSTPTTPTYLPEFIQRRRRSSESGFFVEGNCLGGDRFLFGRIWSEIKTAIMDDQNAHITCPIPLTPTPTPTHEKIIEKCENEDAELAAWIRHEEKWNAMMARATESPSTPGKYIDEIFEFHTIICEFTLNPQIIPILVLEKNIIDYFMFHLVKHYDTRCFLYAALALENICEAAIVEASDASNATDASDTFMMTVLQNHAAEICRVLAPIVNEGFAAHEVDATWTHLEYIEARRACARIYHILSVDV